MIRKLSTFAVVVLLAATAAVAGIPDEFENLQVLPEDTGKVELIGLMADFTGALGMRCESCHVQAVPGDFESFDWVSDELENKRVARDMMRMVETINGNLLVEAGKADHTVSCVTCHRGLSDPATLVEVMDRSVDSEGVDTAVELYRELRDQYFGTGSYDFSPNSLRTVAEHRARNAGDLDGALAFCDLNVEFNGDDIMAWLGRASVHSARGDNEAAAADVRKALEIDPENDWAKQMLAELEG